MPHPGSTVETSAARLPQEDTPPDDGWRSAQPAPAADLSDLRAELDRIDDAVQDLLIRRAQVVEQVGRTGKPAAFRPGREASIVRRLVKRHQGLLPSAALFRIWRELLAGTTSMQGGFSLAVSDADPAAALTQLSREHFGALTPLRRYANVDQALADVSQAAASVAVLPFPSDTDTWWLALAHHQPRLHIVARLPFWPHRPDGAPQAQALVVATAPPDASAEDRSFVDFECDSDVNRTELANALINADLATDTMLLSHESGSATARILADVAGFLTDDDPRLSRLGMVLRRPVVLGSYAVPFSVQT